jgi:putative transposase
MTQPRFVLPGDTVMVTRRTLRRHHLFRPDPAIRQLYLYTLAMCARQFGILVHAVTLMSTDEHLVDVPGAWRRRTDVGARLLRGLVRRSSASVRAPVRLL